MYVRTYVHTYVAGCLEVRCGVPVDLNVTKKGHINFVVILSYHKVEAEQGHDRSNSQVQARMAIGMAIAAERLQNSAYDYRAKPGPGLR